MAHRNAGPAAWMPWAMVLVFAVVSAATAATTSLLFRAEPAPAMAGSGVDSSDFRKLEREVGEVQSMLRELSHELAFASPGIERIEMPEPSRRGPGPSLVADGEEDDEEGSPEEGRREGGFGRGGDMRGAFESMRALRSGTEAERLAAAREMLNGDNAMGKLMAIDVLVELSPEEGLAALKEYAADPEAGAGRGRDTLSRTLEKLSKVEGIDYAAELVALFDSGNESVRRTAARALADAGDDRLIRDLLGAASTGLYATEMKDRLSAIEDISRLGSSAATDYLLPLLSDSSVEVRLNALNALRRTADENAIAAIESMLNDPIERVRENAESALNSIRNPRARGGDRSRGGFGGGNFGGGDRGGRGGGDTGGRQGRGGRGGRGG